MGDQEKRPFLLRANDLLPVNAFVSDTPIHFGNRLRRELLYFKRDPCFSKILGHSNLFLILLAVKNERHAVLRGKLLSAADCHIDNLRKPIVLISKEVGSIDSSRGIAVD